MPTDPLPAALGPLLEWLNWAGLAVFALTGALLAAEKKQTFVTFTFFAVATAVGGGTVRDLLIGAPVFWIHENATLLICLAAASAVWFLPSRLWRGQAILWFDAAGLAAFASFGAAKSLAYGIAPLPAFGMGVLTGCLGGIIRDVLAGRPSILMRAELYVTAAALAAALLVILVEAGMHAGVAALLAAIAGFALRGAAIWRGWSLPHHSR